MFDIFLCKKMKHNKQQVIFLSVDWSIYDCTSASYQNTQSKTAEFDPWLA